MRDAVAAKKPLRKGATARAPRLADAVVAIKIRKKVIMMLNNPNMLQLDILPGQEVAIMKWFLKELSEDVAASAHREDPLCDREADPQAPPVDAGEEMDTAEEADIRKEILEELRGHPRCKSALFAPSRCQIKVTRDDKVINWFGFKNLKAKRKRCALREPRDVRAALGPAYEAVKQGALMFLDEVDLPALQAS